MASTKHGPIAVSYPADLPISERRAELREAIGENQVVIVAGETGSGKSTQLPKICIELGLHESGWIGHTQPRRIAARSIAERVAEELNSTVGELVGYKVRFTDNVSNRTAIKAMTDGILLAEMQHDRKLSKYSMIIIDEAHERSLNIDFLLGYLKKLLPQRPDLKLIVTSATIDTERFSAHFGGAPIIEVSGRTYPVETRYRPLDGLDDEPLSQPEAIADAVIELEKHGPGDILVFCSGEREIREAADELSDRNDLDVLPLYGRLSAAEQHRVFDRKKSGKRRIVLATNVAETSLTVPGIRYVIDPGTARISRYSHRTKVQRLPIEAVSQASANQRAGRCGRLGPGVCIRLFSEEDFESRTEFTEPEITRTGLASVLLQMASLGLGRAEDFPFVDPPEARNIRDGVLLLEELGAIDQDKVGKKGWLTPIGRSLARLPVDPRFGRMVIEAEATGCLDEVIIITAALSVQDPRERPKEKQQLAAEAHNRFSVAGSDFLPWLGLWEHLETERRARSRNQFRKLCRNEYLNSNRVREWQDIVTQLRNAAKSQRWTLNTVEASPDNVHQALLVGLLSHIGRKDSNGNEFTGGRQARFILGRSSALAKKPPNWIMAGELVETNRLWAHSGARIQPEWAERAGEHVANYSYDEPEWDGEKGSAMTIERVSLYGLQVVSGRRVHYRRVDRVVARELFIHHALIEGDWTTHHAFVAQNESVLDEVRVLGARQRRDLFVEYDVLFDFFDERIPAKVTSGADFDRWWNKAREHTPELLDLNLNDIFDLDAVEDTGEFPTSWTVGDLDLDLSYEFDSTSSADGMTVHVPIAVLGHLNAETFEGNVSGMQKEVVTELLRSLPKSVRKLLVPIPDTVEAILPALDASEGPLLERVRRALNERSGVALPPDALSLDRLPDHLRPRFEVIDEDGRALARGRDLDRLRIDLAEQVRTSLSSGKHDLATTGSTTWDFGDLPQNVATTAAGQDVIAYPSLIDEGDSVGVQLLASDDEQHHQMWLGTRRLLRLNVGGTARMLNDILDNRATLAIASSPHESKTAWVQDAADCIFSKLLAEAGGPVRTEAKWNTLVEQARAQLGPVTSRIGPLAVSILRRQAAIRATLAGLESEALQPARGDVTQHLNRLVYPGHLSGVGADRLADVDRYLSAIEERLTKLPDRIRQDSVNLAMCRELESLFDGHAERLGNTDEIVELNWALEELRVATFAQHLGVKNKVSAKKLRTALGRL